MLTEEQKQAIAHKDGPMMVVAGPGSGKTMVLTQRVKQLLACTKPQRILVITFARKAAEEMRARFALLAGDEAAKAVNFGTFHAIFYRWLRKWGVLTPEHQILEEETAQQLYQELGWDMEDIPAFLLCHRDAAAKYRREKEKRGLVDFEDLIELTAKEIGAHPVWQRYDYVLIDEFQDINPQQYAIVRQMVNPRTPNLFVVGDEDQAIYAFRGSDPKIFLQFPKDFPGCRRIDLSVNFRCQAAIVKAAGELIQNNRQRFEKRIQAHQIAREVPRLYRAFDEKEEAKLIRDQIEREHRQGVSYSEMAVLCRTKAQLRRISAALEEAGVPYEWKQSLEGVGKHEELLIGRDLELFLRLGRNSADREAFRKILPFLEELQGAGNWRRVAEGEPVLANLLEQPMGAAARRELTELAKRLKRSGRMEKMRAYRYLLWQTDYLTYAYRKAKSRGLSKRHIGKQIRQLLRPGRKKVLLSTMHGAKGLEFDWVWVAGLVEGECPRREAVESGTLEEERRLLYVAMTRARKRLSLSYYDGLGTEPSRFLKEIKSLQISS